MIPPDQFIPVAAESPLIHDLGFWVLEQTCEQINRWRGHLPQRHGRRPSA